MGNYVGPPLPSLTDEEEAMVLGLDTSINGIVKYIKKGRATQIVLMVGAGISVSAGIPDFRTPGSGLYDNLRKYNLPKPESMFDIEYFRENPRPFYDLARDLLPSNFRPTPTHFFIKLLQDKGLLKRCYTQNIDTLERQAGVDSDFLVEAHGSFGSAHCIECGAAYSMEYFRDRVVNMTDKIPDPDASPGQQEPTYIPWCKCSKVDCNGNVKPDIVFFGEGLPPRFFELRNKDLESTDLLIVCGTSLAVAPFCNTMHLCNAHAPRLLVNLERVGMPNWMSDGHGFKFDMRGNYRDVELLGTCDDGVRVLCDQLGWRGDLERLINSYSPGETTGLTSRESSAMSTEDVFSSIPIDPSVLCRNQRIAKDAPLTSEEEEMIRQEEHALAAGLDDTGDSDNFSEDALVALTKELSSAAEEHGRQL